MVRVMHEKDQAISFIQTTFLLLLTIMHYPVCELMWHNALSRTDGIKG